MAGGGVTPSVCPLSVLISHQPEVSAVNTSHILDLRNQIRPVTTSPSPSCPTIHCSSASSWIHGAVGSSWKSPGGSTCGRFRSIDKMSAGSCGWLGPGSPGGKIDPESLRRFPCSSGEGSCSVPEAVVLQVLRGHKKGLWCQHTGPPGGSSVVQNQCRTRQTDGWTEL